MISICFILFLLISILTSSNGQVTCASGWSQYVGNCYLIAPAFNSGSTEGTWDQCNAYCPTSYPGATMLCVESATENEWIWNKYPGYAFWIGYTDMLPYGGGKGTNQYGWVAGCSSTYTKWREGQPNNYNNMEDYAVVNWFGTSRWDDIGPVGFVKCGCKYTPASPTAFPSFSSSQGDVSE